MIRADFSDFCTTLETGATRRLLQSGWCFAALVNCRFMHHGRRFHCATPATVLHFLSGLSQAKLQYRRGVASSEQLPSREPFRLFDEKRVAPFSCAFSFTAHAVRQHGSRQRWRALAAGTTCRKLPVSIQRTGRLA